MSKTETRHHHWLAGILFGMLAAGAVANEHSVAVDKPLEPDSRHENIGELIAQFVQKSHYLHISVNDDLSSRVLDRYIDSLDSNRMYLLASDIADFDQYRYRLDDIVKSRPLDPVYEMFKVYRTRARERLNFALLQLETEPDFTNDEHFQFDRSDEPWIETTAELDEIVR